MRERVQQDMKAINEALRAAGGAAAGYSCKTVSWDDASRGTTASGGISCWGRNITDVRLAARDGTPLYVVRPDNWNEKLGVLPSSEIACVAADLAGATESAGSQGLRPVRLCDLLKNAGKVGAYAGLDADKDLYSAEADSKVSVRFQTTFLPVGSEAKSSLEFATEAYNYQTTDNNDPKNLLLLCTSQGVAMQTDGRGSQKLLLHKVQPGGAAIHRCWLEAEKSRHKVGGAQVESAAEKADALARNKATAAVIGTRAMGTRFNVLMTVQVPLKQKPPPQRRPRGFVSACGFGGDDGDGEDRCYPGSMKQSKGGSMKQSKGVVAQESKGVVAQQFKGVGGGGGAFGGAFCGGGARYAAASSNGTAQAARVSRGSVFDTNWGGLGNKNPLRAEGEHLTATIVFYNTISGGTPTPEDVLAAVQDMEELYAACTAQAGGATGQLADDNEALDFFKKPLEPEDVKVIAEKLAHDPPLPAVHNFDTFPSGMEQ